jgi:protein TonB
MEVKKVASKDVSRLRGIFFLVGLNLILSVVYGVINYKKYDPIETDLDDAMVIVEEEVEVEQTIQEETPPPPPEAPPILEVVEDDEIIEDEQPEIEDIETNDDDIIDDFIPMIEEEMENTGEVLEFWQVQKKAEFRGGESQMYKFIGENIVIPHIAQEESEGGTVRIKFVVEKNGAISNISILGSRRLGYGCDEAAVDVVKKMSGMWEPALQRDKPVRRSFTLPVRFDFN